MLRSIRNSSTVSLAFREHCGCAAAKGREGGRRREKEGEGGEKEGRGREKEERREGREGEGRRGRGMACVMHVCVCQ